VAEKTGELQEQAGALAKTLGARLANEGLGPKDIRAIMEALAFQKSVHVFAHLVAATSPARRKDLVAQSLPLVEEALARLEKALAEAPGLRIVKAPQPPSVAHPLSIRATLAEIRLALGLPATAPGQVQAALPPSPLEYMEPGPTEEELQTVRFNLERLREAAELMGRGKCYREFWTRYCGDALESHALAHQKRSFVKLLVKARDLLRKYCSSPKLAALRQEYQELLRDLTIRPIVYDYGTRTTPFIDRPELFRLGCAGPG
jgi:hypothetical protein